MHIRDIAYIKSAPEVALSPNTQGQAEIAFVGRSNVGKSSLINLLANRKSLAHVSKTPGKTIYFNYYWVNQSHYWVDMPGYGFAKVSQQQRSSWIHTWEEFVRRNQHLSLVCVLIDARVPLQKADEEMIHSLAQVHLQWAIIFTKCEKIKSTHIQNLIATIQQILPQQQIKIPYFVTSAVNRQGRDEVLDYMSHTIESHGTIIR